MLTKRWLISVAFISFLFANAWAVELFGRDESNIVNLVEDMFGKKGSYEPSVAEPLWFCGTPIILGLSAVWDELSADSKEKISNYVDVPDFASLRRVSYQVSHDDKNRSPKKSVWPYGYYASNQYQTEHFNIKWGSSATYDEDTIQMLGQALEDAWSVEVEQLGYPEPDRASEYYIDFYIGGSGDDVPPISFQGAYTTVYSCNPQEQPGCYPPPAYIVMHPDILYHQGATRDVTSHEFFHVIQFGIVIGRWCFADDEDMWWWEATATWMEDAVWDNINSYAYYIHFYSEAPHEALHSDVNFYYPYSRVIWSKYLSENHGGNDAIRSIWTECDIRGTLFGIDAYLQSYDGYTLKQAFGEFMAKNAILDYEEKDLYESYPYADLEFERLAVHSSYPVAKTVDSQSVAPRYLGANIIEFASHNLDSPKNLVISFNGRDSLNNYDVDWRAQLLIERRDSTYEFATIALDEADNSGEVIIEDFGGSVYKVYLIPCVVKWMFKGGAQVGVSYEYSANLEEPAGGDDDGDSGSEGDGDSGCGLF